MRSATRPQRFDGSTIGDLKGKKIAFQKTSIGNYLLVKALTEAGLTLDDVQSVYLPPPDSNAAFSQNPDEYARLRPPPLSAAGQ